VLHQDLVPVADELNRISAALDRLVVLLHPYLDRSRYGEQRF
jgi:hypothetical protein